MDVTDFEFPFHCGQKTNPGFQNIILEKCYHVLNLQKNICQVISFDSSNTYLHGSILISLFCTYCDDYGNIVKIAKHL